jgi:hemerythrin-like metal-binding protein
VRRLTESTAAHHESPGKSYGCRAICVEASLRISQIHDLNQRLAAGHSLSSQILKTGVPVSQLEWSEALALNLPVMDDTHREFVDLLAVVETAPDETLPAHWRALVDHTDEHFAREDQWMQATRFSSTNCHSVQHKVVLQVMREGIALAEAGDLGAIRQMARELAIWFPQHAQTMDAALALHLRGIGYDPLTGIVAMPEALPSNIIHGCGGASCSDSETLEPTAQAA